MPSKTSRLAEFWQKYDQPAVGVLSMFSLEMVKKLERKNRHASVIIYLWEIRQRDAMHV
jgi:hypothetical protein